VQLTGPRHGGSTRSLRLFLRQRAIGALAVFLLTTGAPSVQAEPYLPTDDTQVLEQLPTPAGGTRRELRSLREELAKNPEDLELAVRLARRYIEIGRAEGDPRYYGQAEALLQGWWTLDEPPTAVRILRATLRQNRHEFDAALSDLSAVLQAAPRDAQAWLTQAVILQVMGRHDQARRSCTQLATLATPLVSAACLADVASISGDAANASALLRRAIDAAPDADVGLRQWAMTILAEIAARTGAAADAERNFRAALALGVKDSYLLGAYADFLLDQHRPTEVRDLLASETRIDPLLLRLALAEAQLGEPELAEHVAALQARFDTARRRGDTVHRREEARFALHLLGKPAEALRLALDNWAVQREAWDARLVLEAALAADAIDDAAEVLVWLKKTGLEDRQIAGMVDRIGGARR
jgi:tetratricopeptide (TPR) repeat protein